MKDIITITHGNGGKQTKDLIEAVFYKFFQNPYLKELDSAVVNIPHSKLAITTDSHVIKPIFFSGGDIGKLSITGTINDLAVVGARPLFITAGFIIEEGLELSTLKKILESMAEELQKHEIAFIAGDTKVVSKGECDSIFITTTGIGVINDNAPLGLEFVKEGDLIVVSGTIGEHGASIYLSRNNLEFDLNIKSDCESIYVYIDALLKECKTIKIIRDPTRGGLGTVLNEFVRNQSWGILLYEEEIPVKEEVRGISELLGIEVLHLACEGRFVFLIGEEEIEKALRILKQYSSTSSAKVVGKVTKDFSGKVVLQTMIGGKRILEMLSNEVLPRIC